MIIAKRFISSALMLLVFIAFCIPTSSVFAAVPTKESVKYNGAGKVEVEFYGDVVWKGNPKVTVKDSSGKKYNASVYAYDDDEIKFKIKKYKKGKKYNFRIGKVREEYTSSFGTVKGKVRIPKASKFISRTKAKNIALNHAAKRYNINKNRVYDLDIERDYYGGTSVWEVDFETYKGGYEHSFEYKIRAKGGKIIYYEHELDD